MFEAITAAVVATLSLLGWVLMRRAQKNPTMYKVVQIYNYTYTIAGMVAGWLLCVLFNRSMVGLMLLTVGCLRLYDLYFIKKQPAA